MSATEIIVGVDGSAASDHALRWAAVDAMRRGVDLVVVHVYDWRIYGAAAPISARFVTDAHDVAESVVRRAVDEAESVAPTVTVRGAALLGAAGPTLVAGSGNGAMTVVGNRGRNGFASLALGSVGHQVATHAAGPVVVVRGRSDVAGPVVVGVDGSAGSEAALAVAFEEASLQASGLLAVRAYVSASVGRTTGTPVDVATSEHHEAEQVHLAEQVAPWREKYPEVAVEAVAVEGQPAAVLAGISERARLVVVGTRGHGGFAGLLLGSVGLQLLHHADCPVLIARTHDGQAS